MRQETEMYGRGRKRGGKKTNQCRKGDRSGKYQITLNTEEKGGKGHGDADGISKYY